MRPFPALVQTARPAVLLAFAALLHLLTTVTASAQDVGDFSEDVPLEGMVTEHPCTGEVVVLEGHMKFHSTTSPDGTVQIHIEMHGVSATTVPVFPGQKPRKYVCNETQNNTTKFDPDGPASQHTRWNFTFIRSGEDGGIACCGDDFHLHVNIKLDLAGPIAIPTMEDLDGECK